MISTIIFMLYRVGGGDGSEGKKEKNKIIPDVIRCLKNKKCENERTWYSAQGPGRMAQTPQAGTGDSVSRFAVITAQL